MAKRIEGDLESVTNGTKTVSLTFSSENELKIYESYSQAAKSDDRSIASFIVCVLLGKEDAPTAHAQ